MKTINLVILIASFALSAFEVKADVIVLDDGTVMQVHNIELSSKWIFYTETANEESPIKKVAVDKVFGYKIGDGNMTTIDSDKPEERRVSSETSSAKTSNPQFLTPVPASNNNALIDAYNNHPPLVHNKKKPEVGKYIETFYSLWGVEEGSILSDENIEIGFEKESAEILKKRRIIGVRIKITNKTDYPIYIDLASSYKIMNGGYAVPYFTNSVYSEGTSGTRGASMNMGAITGALGIGGVLGTLANGINIGGANTKSAEISTGEQQIISIPPHAVVFLPGDKVSNGTRIVECFEPLFFNNQGLENTSLSMAPSKDLMPVFELVHLTMAKDEQSQKINDSSNLTSADLEVCRWMQTSFTPENSPKKIGRIITYSTSPDFSTYTSLPVNLYMRGAFGNKIVWKGDEFYCEKLFDCITDPEHFIVGTGYIRKK